MKRDKITVNDRQLACARITSQEGQDYLKGMAAAGNYAWVNRSSMTFLTRQVRRGAYVGCRQESGCFSRCHRLSGLFQGVRHNTRRPGHARHLRRVAQHRQGGGARGRRQAEDSAGPPEGLHPGVPPTPPAHPRRLPGESASRRRRLKVGPSSDWQPSAAHRAAGADRRNHGNLQLRPDGDRAGHDGDVRHHLPRSGMTRSSHAPQNIG